MGNNLITEVKNTFSSLMSSAKTMDDEDTKVRSQEEERRVNNERESAHTRMVEDANNSFTGTRRGNNSAASGKKLNTVSQDSRPMKAILVNESSTVRVMEPKEKDDVYLIIGELKSKQPVLVKLGSVEQNEKRSILDVLYGACAYADYTVEPVDTQIILIDPSFSTPKNNR